VHRARFLLLALALTCSLVWPARSQGLIAVKVSTVPIDAGAEVFYAKEMGFFARAGLDVEILTAPNGNASASSVAGGAADIGYADTVTLALGHGKSIPFVIVAPGALHVSPAPTTLLLVSPGSPVRSAKDLEGKVVAGSGLTTISGYSPRAWIDQNGGDSTKVRFIEMAFPAMAAALDAGRIDAAMIAEPFLASARRDHRVLGVPYDAVAKEFIISAYFTTAGWAKDHPDALTRFVNVIHDTAIWANANHARSAEILVAATRADPASVGAMTRVRYGDRLTAPMLQPVVNVAAKYSGIAPYPAQELIYSR
jgi:NitT/TauT family transport system substrate-binding protein